MNNTPSPRNNTTIIERSEKIIKRVYSRIIVVNVLHIVGAILLIIIITILTLVGGTIELPLQNQTLSDAAVGLGGLSTANITELNLPIVSITIGILAYIILLPLLSVLLSAAKAAILVNDVPFGESIKFGFTKGFEAILPAIIPTLLILGSMLLAGVTLFVSISLIVGVYTTAAVKILVGIVTAILLIFFALVSIMINLRSKFIYFVWITNQKQKAWWIVKKSFALTKGTTFWIIVLFSTIFTTIGLIGATITGVIGLLISILIAPVYWSVLNAIYESAEKKSTGVKK